MARPVSFPATILVNVHARVWRDYLGSCLVPNYLWRLALRHPLSTNQNTEIGATKSEVTGEANTVGYVYVSHLFYLLLFTLPRRRQRLRVVGADRVKNAGNFLAGE